MPPLSRRVSRAAAILALAASSVAFAACSSVEFGRDTESSGTFVARGTGVTIFGVDVPRSGLNQARENASDAGLHNLIVTEVTIFPDWGPLDFLLEIFSVRTATIHGTWGYREG